MSSQHVAPFRSDHSGGEKTMKKEKQSGEVVKVEPGYRVFPYFGPKCMCCVHADAYRIECKVSGRRGIECMYEKREA